MTSLSVFSGAAWHYALKYHYTLKYHYALGYHHVFISNDTQFVNPLFQELFLA